MAKINMRAYILGIDIGTGSTKAVAVNFEGKPIGESQFYYPISNPKPGYQEQNPFQILEAFKNCITSIINKIGESPIAISFSCAMHTLIPVDKDCWPLAEMMTWADYRSESIAERIRTGNEGELLYRACGTPIHAMSPLCKIIWLRENIHDLFVNTYKFISIKEFIWHYLFNEFEVDYSIASSSGLFNILDLNWDTKACELAGITSNQLSNLVKTTYLRDKIVHKALNELNLNPNTKFVIGASDGCCANLGSDTILAGTAALTIGTSGAVRITGKKPIYNFNSMTFNYLLNNQTYVSGGAINNGGIVFKWLVNTFTNENTKTGEDAYNSALNQIKNIAVGSDDLVFLPYLYGERAPIWDTKSCGVFFNIKPSHTSAHFLRAGLEGICYALFDVLTTIETSSAPIKQLNISGGFINSPIWVQILADITGKRLSIVQTEDASAIGAIYLAMEALDISIPKNENLESIEPDMNNHQQYNQAFKLFKLLYTNLKDTMHLINR